jgi:hypothetical protein
MNSIEQRPLTPWATRTGVIVGGAYIRPPKPMSADAEQIQSALLNKRKHDPVDRIVMRGCGVAALALVAMGVLGWL